MRFILLVLASRLASVPIAGDEATTSGFCVASWESADRDGDDVLDGREATLCLATMFLHKAAAPESARVDRSRFVAACLAGIFRTGYVQAQ